MYSSSWFWFNVLIHVINDTHTIISMFSALPCSLIRRVHGNAKYRVDVSLEVATSLSRPKYLAITAMVIMYYLVPCCSSTRRP